MQGSDGARWACIACTRTDVHFDKVPRRGVAALCVVLIGIVGGAQCLGTSTQPTVGVIQTVAPSASDPSIHPHPGLPSVLLN